MNAGAAKLARAFGRSAARCVRKEAPDLEACIEGNAALLRADAALEALAGTRCDSPPDFGLTDPATIGAAVREEGFDWLRGLLGPDLEAALATVDPAEAKCQQGLVREAARLVDARWRAALGAKRASLAGGAPSAEALALDVAAAVQVDAGVGRRVGALFRRMNASCDPGALGSLFPGRCSAASAASLAACVDALTDCAFCRAFDASDGVSLGCELHDDGTANDSCMPRTTCGDGDAEEPEECDDGNTADGDGCSALCLQEAVCGDGEVQDPEECDDGNTSDGDGCSALCTGEPGCGDGEVQDPEECDDGNTAGGDGCSGACAFEPVCGDGEREDPEQCDDGNTLDGDGCSASCANLVPDPSAPAVFGSLSLGFRVESASVGITAGGPVSLSVLGGNCYGYTTSAPSVQVTYRRGVPRSSLLRFYAVAGSDTTLFVRAPDGTYLCVDDSFGTLNPTIDFNSPAGGIYDVWVATYAAGASIGGTLYVTQDSAEHP
jgi:cysteine-rich repeat protein